MHRPRPQPLLYSESLHLPIRETSWKWRSAIRDPSSNTSAGFTRWRGGRVRPAALALTAGPQSPLHPGCPAPSRKFPVAAVTKCHQLGGFTQQNFIPSLLWGPEVRSQGVSRATLPPKRPGSPFPPPPAPGGQSLGIAGVPWLVATSLRSCLRRPPAAFRPSTAASLLFSEAHPSAQIKGLPSSRVTSSTLITSAVTLPKRITSGAPGRTRILEDIL